MTWPRFSETSTDMHVEFNVLFNQTCLLVNWKSKRKATWPMPLHQTWQLTMCNFISQNCYIVNTTYMPCRDDCSCKIYSCWTSVTVTNTAAVQTCLLVECCCKMDACWAVATQFPFWTPSWIYQIPSDALAAAQGYYKDNVCNSRLSKIRILHANPWSLPVSGNFFLFFVINCYFSGHIV